MKNKNHLQGVVRFLRRELEITLAVLVVLGFIFGHSLASSDLATGDAKVQVAQTSNVNLPIYDATYSGITFGTASLSGAYKAVTGFTPTSVITTADGTRGADLNTTYTYRLTLESAASGGAYLHGTYTTATVNGTSVTPTTPVTLAGTALTVTFKGGTIQRLVSYPGAEADSNKNVVANLFVLPNTATLEVNKSISLQAIALNANGQALTVSPAWSIASQYRAYASVNASTGVITGIAPGRVVVQANVNGLSASATITVKTPMIQPPATTTPSTGTQNQTQTQTTPRSEQPATSEPVADEPTSVADQVAEALQPTQTQTQEQAQVAAARDEALNLFAANKVQERLVQSNSIRPTQADINAVVAQQTTFAQKAIVRLTAVVEEIRATLTEIAVGRTVVMPDGSLEKRPSALQAIGSVLLKFVGGDKIGGAAPTGFEGEGIEPI
jgi:hypothetical protein